MESYFGLRLEMGKHIVRQDLGTPRTRNATKQERKLIATERKRERGERRVREW